MPMRLAQSTAAILPMRDARGGSVPVLHVMTERAVVHDVIELDHAVVPGAEMPVALLGDRRLDGHDSSRTRVYGSNGAGER